VSYADYLEHLQQTAGADPALRASLNGVRPVEAPLYETYSKLCKGTPMQLRRDARQAVIEQLYSRVNWIGRVAIAVYTEERQGFGDIVLGLKTAQLYRQALGRNANQYDVAFIVDKRTRESMGDLGAGYGIEPIQLPEGDKFTGDAGLIRVQSLVRAPVLSSAAAFQELRAYKTFICETTQEIGFTEYAKVEPESVPTGLKPKELGITVNHELRGYQRELLGLEPGARPAFRATFMAGVADPVFNAIVGERCEDPVRLREQTLAERSVASNRPFSIVAPDAQVEGARGLQMVVEARADARLYFGYSNRSGTTFIKVIVALEAGKPDHVCIVHPSANYFDKYWPSFWDEIQGPYLAALKKAGFGGVEVIEITPDVTTKYCLVNADSPRILRIVLPKRLRPQDMMALFKASEPVVIVTGNQSTSEALSAGKSMIYECLAFEQNQQFMKDLFDLGEVAVGKNKSMSNFFTASKKLSQKIIESKVGNPSDKECEDVAALLVDAKMEAGFHQLSELACTTKDLSDRLVGMYIRARLHRDRKLGPALEKIEGDVQNNEPGTFQTFFEALTGLLAAVE